jgi:hypothetical protein
MLPYPRFSPVLNIRVLLLIFSHYSHKNRLSLDVILCQLLEAETRMINNEEFSPFRKEHRTFHNYKAQSVSSI